jgi:hypothetical protein
VLGLRISTGWRISASLFGEPTTVKNGTEQRPIRNTFAAECVEVVIHRQAAQNGQKSK